MFGKPNQKVSVAPLTPVPVVKEPFSQVFMDSVGSFPKTRKGNEFLLTIIDVTTFLMARSIIEALVCFSLGLSCQSRCNMTRKPLLFHVMSELGISQAVSSAYHPKSQLDPV